MVGVAVRVAAASALAVALVAASAPAVGAHRAGLYSGPGFDTRSAPCTQAVQAFLAGWVTRLRGAGWLAGVYGSAASTTRDTIPSFGTPSGPDAVWIADWNGNTSVFGDPYVADAYWPDHQRI